MRQVLFALVMPGFLFACTRMTTGPVADAGEVEEEVPYEGETVNGAIPVVEPPEEVIVQVDAGEFSVDKRCCNLNFSIEDTEPGTATGSLVGSYGVMSADGGLQLARGGGKWTANMCFPLGHSTVYSYVFRVPAILEDGGTDEDGGTVDVVRHSSAEQSVDDGFGGVANVIPPAANCEALDASVGMLP